MEKVSRFIINPEKIGFFKAVLESYEEVAVMTVMDGKEGRVDLIYPSDAEGTLRGIIVDMERYGVHFREATDV